MNSTVAVIFQTIVFTDIYEVINLIILDHISLGRYYYLYVTTYNDMFFNNPSDLSHVEAP